MNQLKKIYIWVFVVALISATGTGCTTSPETNSSSSQNHGIEDKKLEDSGYY